MMIRTAILSIPAPHADASAAVRALLRDAVEDFVVVQDAYAGGSRNWIEETLRRWCDEEEIDLILTIGGTMPAPGHSGEERTPEATEAQSLSLPICVGSTTRIGEPLMLRSPSPAPQHQSVPSVLIAQVWLRPAATPDQLAEPIAIGASRSSVVPSPSWPLPLLPQQWSVPPARRPHVCEKPAVSDSQSAAVPT